MNPLAAENEFRAGLERIVAGIVRKGAPAAADPRSYEKDKAIHERETRVFFFDRLLDLLDWNLGVEGNVTQEARIKAGTTKFVDYVGVNQETRAPVLILEAKAWGKPVITGKGEKRGLPKARLIVEAVKHVNAGGNKENSPVTAEWHEHLSQLAGYVCHYWKKHGHAVSRAVLSSGQWLLVFKEPVSTFCDNKVSDRQFHLFERDEYVENAHVIFELLARVKLAGVVPDQIRPSQLGNYVNKVDFISAYHGMVIRYEKSGTVLFAKRPLILVYPSVIIEREGGALFTVIDVEDPIPMQISCTGNGEGSLRPHLEKVATAAEELLQSCSDELGMQLEPGDLVDFPGFPMVSGGLALGEPRKLFVKSFRAESNNWLAVTGRHTHYIQERPKSACHFHSWATCNEIGQAIGPNAVNSPATDEPRAFFVDGQPHHCAHRVVIDRRVGRCYIMAIDARTCCKACVYHDTCWLPEETSKLPCGK